MKSLLLVFSLLFVSFPAKAEETGIDRRVDILNSNEFLQVLKEAQGSGGVTVTTITFSSANFLLSPDPGEVVGVIASTTSERVYLSFRATGSVVGYETTDEKFAIHLDTGPTGTWMKIPFSIPSKKGWAVKCNVNTIRLITIVSRHRKEE